MASSAAVPGAGPGFRAGSHRFRGGCARAVVVAGLVAMGVHGGPAAAGGLTGPAARPALAGCVTRTGLPGPVPAGSSLAGVAVVAGCGVLAVGSEPTGLGSQVLAVRWDGARWRQVPAADPGAGLTPGSGLAGVAAGPGGSAWAVGWYGAERSGMFPLADRWDGSAWRRVRVLSPGPGPRPQARLLGVAVWSAGRAWAVGDYAVPGGGLRALIERWDGRSWRAARVPVPAGSARSVLDGVAVVSARDVWAVGYRAARSRGGGLGGDQPLAEHWDGTAWRVARLPGLPGGRGSGALTAAGAAGGRVWAAGWFAAAGRAAGPLAERWDGRSWRVARVPVPAGAARSALTGIAAVSRGRVLAVGWLVRGGVGRPLAEWWDGGSWRVMPGRGGLAGRGSLAAVAAAGSRSVWAVGSGPGRRGLVPLALRLSGGWWRRAGVPSDAAPLAAVSAGRAQALAAATGRPVAVTGEMNEWTRVYAVPRGGFAARVSLVPQQVRARPGGRWVPVDTKLAVRAGRVAPAATAADVSLSDGGSGPLYTLSSGPDSLSVSWPYGPLPVPVLTGPTATYPDVLPGVNLLVSATDTGVQVLIEVMGADAAANPDLASITFPVTASGVSLTADSLGNLTAADSSGNELYAAATPQMWDSSATSQVTGPTAGEIPGNSPEPGDLQSVVAVQVGAGSSSLTLTPDASVLSGPGVHYPVFIDPNWNSQTTGKPSWSDVWEAEEYSGSVNMPPPAVQPIATWTGADWEPSSSAGGIRSGVPCDNSGVVNGQAGTCIANDGNQDGGAHTGNTVYRLYRSFLNFPVPSAMWGAAFADGELELNQTYAWSCSNTSYVTMWDTNSGGSNSPSTTSTTWANQPGTGDWLSNSDFGYGYSASDCPGQYVSLPAAQVAQVAAANSWPWLTVRLSANSADESVPDQWSWKRFDASTMILDLYWRNPPAAPANYGTQGVLNPQTGQAGTDCGSVNSPDWVSTNAPVWQAQFDDPDGVNGGSLTAEFPWANVTATSDAGTLDADQDPTGQSPPALFTGSRSGTAGYEYKWQAYASTEPAVDPVGTPVPALPGPASFPWCYFVIDTTPPSAPTISSPDYTSGVAANPVGTQGTFTFSAASGPDPAGVVGFVYGIGNPRPTAYVPVSALGQTASVTLAPFSTAEEDLYVAAVDQAGNVSTVTGPFRIEATASGNIATLGWWKLNGGGADSMSKTPSGGGLTVQGLASYGCPGSASASPAGYTCSLGLDGFSADAAGVPVMGNDTSFSVSAWAYPSSCGQPVCTVVSQDGANVSGFRLGYQPSGTAGSAGVACPCWVFGLPRADLPSAAWDEAAAPAPGAIGKWTQLTGVFAAGHGTLALYVNGGDGSSAGNGSPAGTGFASPWSAPAAGVFRVGDDLGGSGQADFFAGSVSDVCVFYGALAAADVTSLYAGGSGDGCAALAAAYP